MCSAACAIQRAWRTLAWTSERQHGQRPHELRQHSAWQQQPQQQLYLEHLQQRHQPLSSQAECSISTPFYAVSSQRPRRPLQTEAPSPMDLELQQQGEQRDQQHCGSTTSSSSTATRLTEQPPRVPARRPLGMQGAANVRHTKWLVGPGQNFINAKLFAIHFSPHLTCTWVLGPQPLT